ncbi:hypothetical protein PTTG_11148, partial [Puccinia triticina 1-1 BBBD Race 1]
PDLDKLLASCVAQIDGQAEAALLEYDNPLDEIATEHELAAMAGNPDAVTNTKGSSPLHDDELVPEDQVTFQCGSLLQDLLSTGPGGDRYVPVHNRTLHRFHLGRCLRNPPLTALKNLKHLLRGPPNPGFKLSNLISPPLAMNPIPIPLHTPSPIFLLPFPPCFGLA